MTYTKTHALILNHNKHIALTDLRIFMNSSNRFTYIIILVTNLCLFRSLVYGIELILIANLYLSDLTLVADLFLFRSPVGHILILISHKTHTYIDFLVCGTELIHILIRRHLSTYSYLSLSQISRRRSQNLCFYRDTLRYNKAYTYTIGLILILRSLHLFGGTRRYYRDMTERILVLRNLFLYGSTRKYYLFECLKRHILVLISNFYLFKSTVGTTDLYSYGSTRRYYRVYPFPKLIRRYP